MLHDRKLRLYFRSDGKTDYITTLESWLMIVKCLIRLDNGIIKRTVRWLERLSKYLFNRQLSLRKLRTSVTRKKLPKVYKSCPKRTSLVKWKISTPLQKWPKMCWQFGQNNFFPGLWKVVQSLNKSPNLVALIGG